MQPRIITDMILKRIFLRHSLLKYLLTGALAFIADYGIFMISYYTLAMTLFISASIGFFIGLVVSFSLNRFWVHGKVGRERSALRQLAEYTLLILFNYLFTLFFIHLLESIGIHPAIGKVLIMILIVTWNYLIFNRVIFKTKNTPTF